jgi:hypothetical protein
VDGIASQANGLGIDRVEQRAAVTSPPEGPLASRG